MDTEKNTSKQDEDVFVIPQFHPKHTAVPEGENFVIPEAPEPAPEPDIPVPEEPKETPQETVSPEAPAEPQPVAQAEASPAPAGEIPETEQPQEPETTDIPEVEDPAESPRQGSRKLRGILIYCSVIFGIALCALILLCCTMNPLRSRLTQYENSQPEHIRDAVYEILFEDPDWDLIYDMAGVESTAYEGKEAFAAYMHSKLGGRELTCTETSAGLSGRRRYLLGCNSETLAAFTLVNERTPDSDFDAWNLESIEVFLTRDETVTVIKPPEYTAYLNGILMDDSCTTITVETPAEAYLQEGLHGYRWEQQQLGGFWVQPEVVILDENNELVPVYYSEETDTYSTDIPNTPEITEDEYNIVVEAAKTNAEFALRKVTISKLREHFDANSEVYTAICDADPFAKSFRSYKFVEDSITVTDFYRYSDSLFSARVTLKMDVTVRWKTVETYELDTTYFFTKSNKDTYLVTSSTEEALQQHITKVRLTYMQNDTVLLSELTDAAHAPQTPEAIREDGTAAIAWGRLETDGSLTPVLVKNEDGSFVLAEGQTLEPMTLYPIFE